MVKSGGRLADPDPRCYWDNFCSRGGLVKADREVVKTRFNGDRNLQKFNMNCRVENLGSVMAQLTGIRRTWVVEMGFESLFHLSEFRLPRTLCYWLCSHVDVCRRSLRTDDGVELPLSRNQVHWVLGLPVGPHMVPTSAEDPEMVSFVDNLKDKYTTESAGGTKGICRAQIESRVLDESVEELEFKQTFLILALSDFLCPTTSHRLSAAMLPAVSCAMSAKQYDWCSLVLDELIHAVRNFARRFYPNGFALGCGGCTFFLAVFYLDRLNRPPVRWGVFPRTSAWTSELLVQAELDDKLESKDYGKLGTVDAAYTERHPLAARDGLPSTTVYGLASLNPNNSSSRVTVEEVVVSVLRNLEKGESFVHACRNRRRPKKKKRN